MARPEWVRKGSPVSYVTDLGLESSPDKAFLCHHITWSQMIGGVSFYSCGKSCKLVTLSLVSPCENFCFRQFMRITIWTSDYLESPARNVICVLRYSSTVCFTSSYLVGMVLTFLPVRNQVFGKMSIKHPPPPDRWNGIYSFLWLLCSSWCGNQWEW